MQPFSQPFFWIKVATVTPPANAFANWLNGLPEPGLSVSTRPVGSMTYWFNGLPGRVIKGG